MKTFTKIFLAFALVVVYCSGYGASLKYLAKNEHAYGPKTPGLMAVDASVWLDKSGSSLVTVFKPAFDFSALQKSISRTLNMPQRPRYSFTANASQNSMLGVHILGAQGGLDDKRSMPTLNAFPNPSNGKFVITLRQPSDANYQIKVSNTIGKLVMTLNVPKDHTNFTFDLSNEPAGIYFYSLLENNKMVETKRLILQQ